MLIHKQQRTFGQQTAAPTYLQQVRENERLQIVRGVFAKGLEPLLANARATLQVEVLQQPAPRQDVFDGDRRQVLNKTAD
jgi:hypothetical protein